MLKEVVDQNADSLEIGQDRFHFTQEAHQFLNIEYSSKYPKDTSVIIISEPHDSSEGQFNLFKGLESFFGSNPELVKQTIFLSEGTAANKPISVASLIKEEPYPSDDTIRKILQTFMITGYMAYEWKYQQGIPIIGTEDEGLYELSRRFASLCRDNPNAVFQHRKPVDGDEYDIPLTFGWGFAAAARNKRIAQTLIEQNNKYKNPILFVATDHVRDRRLKFEKDWDVIIKRNLLQAQGMGPFGVVMFPWNLEGENYWLFKTVKDDTETFDITHYLEVNRVGYTYLSSKGEEIVSNEDKQTYDRVFRAQKLK